MMDAGLRFTACSVFPQYVHTSAWKSMEKGANPRGLAPGLIPWSCDSVYSLQ